MPKQSIPLSDFSGGINTVSDERDLLPNETTALTNLDPSSPGRVKPSSIITTGVTSVTGTSIGTKAASALDDPGFGLFVFGNDYTFNKTNGSPAASENEEFIVKQDGDGNIDIYDSHTNSWIGDAATGISTKMSCYSADGDLFISGDHSTTPNSLIHVKRKDLDGLTLARTVNIWLERSQEKPKPTSGTMDVKWSGNNVGQPDANNLRWVITWADEDTVDEVNGSWNNDAEQASGTDPYIEFAGTWLYKERAESALFQFDVDNYNGADLSTAASPITIKDAVNRGLYVSAFLHNALTTSAGDEIARYGARLYTRMSNEREWYMLAEVDFEKGIIGDGETDYTPWVNGFTAPATTGTITAPANSCQTGLIESPPAVFSYFANNTYAISDIPGTNSSADDPNRRVYWKHGVVVNGIAYVGNVSMNNRSYGDKIFFSPPYQYDVFSENNYLDVGNISDGDDITALKSFADRLLVFKRRSVTVVNVSQTQAQVETEQQQAGAAFSGAVIETNFGLIWANKNGCFIYDGQGIKNLLYAKSQQGSRAKIDKDTWSSFITDYTTVAYDTQRRQAIVVKGSNGNEEAYVFSFDTQSWHYVTDMLDTTSNTSSFAMSSTGSCLVVGGASNNAVMTIKDRSSTVSGTLETGEIHFGKPTTKKNLHKLSISYVGGSSQNMSVYIACDGGSYGSSVLTLNSATRANAEINLASNADYRGKKSFKIKISGTAATAFELLDVSITYRDIGDYS